MINTKLKQKKEQKHLVKQDLG